MAKRTKWWDRQWRENCGGSVSRELHMGMFENVVAAALAQHRRTGRHVHPKGTEKIVPVVSGTIHCWCRNVQRKSQ